MRLYMGQGDLTRAVVAYLVRMSYGSVSMF